VGEIQQSAKKETTETTAARAVAVARAVALVVARALPVAGQWQGRW
jgi:hypothetical protein